MLLLLLFFPFSSRIFVDFVSQHLLFDFSSSKHRVKWISTRRYLAFRVLYLVLRGVSLFSLTCSPSSLQIGEAGGSWVEQSRPSKPRLEACHLYLVARRAHPFAGQHAELALCWNSPRTAVWIWWALFLFDALYLLLLLLVLVNMVKKCCSHCLPSHGMISDHSELVIVHFNFSIYSTENMRLKMSDATMYCILMLYNVLFLNRERDLVSQ